MNIFDELRGKVAIVTGGNRGVGEGIVDVFADLGIRVMIASRDREKNEAKCSAVAARGGTAMCCSTDVSVESSVVKMVQKTLEEFGTVDILVNNAGWDPRCKWDQITEEDWDKLQAINSKGYFLCAKHATQPMLQKRWGRIINISSSTFWLGNPDALHYATSKGANISFTRSLAMALRGTGITVNCIAPGAVETEKEWTLGTFEYVQNSLNKILEAQLVEGRLQPHHIAWMAAYLCTNAAEFMTGQTVNIDGGRALH